MKDALGTIAAGTLGYIVDNRRGAFNAIGLYKNLPKNKSNMAPIDNTTTKRKRPVFHRAGYSTGKRSSAALGYPTGPRKKLRFAVSKRNSRARLPRKDDGNQMSTYVKKKGRSVKKEARKKLIKVPLKLRKQVKQIMEKSDYVGWFKEKYWNIVYKLGDNVQNVYSLLDRTVNGIPGLLFDPLSVNNAASILFNKRVPGAASLTNADADLFNTATLKIKVIDSSVQHLIKNVTGQTINIKLWDISPKSIIPGPGHNPVIFLQGELLRLAPTGAAGSSTDVSSMNVLGNLVTDIGFSPNMVPAFRQYYSLDETVIRLEPGKEYLHVLKGPSHKLYDYTKFFQNGSITINNAQKFMKQTMICIVGDIQSTTGPAVSVGRFTDTVAADPYGIVVESTMFTKVAMPEQAGFVVPAVPVAAGRSQFLGNRKSAFAIKNWVQTQVGVVVNVDDENPQSVVLTTS